MKILNFCNIIRLIAIFIGINTLLQSMKILITGSAHGIEDNKILNALRPFTSVHPVLVHGNAMGVEKQIYQISKKLKLKSRRCHTSSWSITKNRTRSIVEMNHSQDDPLLACYVFGVIDQYQIEYITRECKRYKIPVIYVLQRQDKTI